MEGALASVRTRVRFALREGRVVPFVGAGVSRAVKSRHTGRPLFPNWMEALEDGVRRLEEDHDPRAVAARRALKPEDPEEDPDYPRAAHEIRAGLGAHDWQRFLENRFGHLNSDAKDSTLATARAIWELGSRVVITTNFDDVLLWANPDAKPWELEDRSGLGAFLRGEYAGAAVWHLHGRYDKAQNVIFTLDAYRALYPEADGEGDAYRALHRDAHRDEDSRREEEGKSRREEVRRYEAALSTLRAVLLTKSLLFVGFSLDDAEFVSELRRATAAFSGFGGEHFALLADTEKHREKAPVLERLEVTPIWYPAPDGDHSALLGYLRDLATIVPPRPTTTVPSELPDPRDRFVGRHKEVRSLTNLLTDGSARPVALVGPSGSGKTRLSREVAAELRRDFAGRVRFADLTEATTTKGLAHAVARALGVALTGLETPARTVTNLLPYQDRTLLVLDHFEQLLAGPEPDSGAGGAPEAAALVRQWCDAAPKLSFLITSTRPLDIGEHLMSLGPLEFLKPGEARCAGRAKLEGLESVALYVARRAERNPAFQLRGRVEEPVGRICGWLRGLPLAIELAARHTADPASVEADLANLLGDSNGDEKAFVEPEDDEVRRELEAALRLSVQALEEDERRALVELSVCNGDFFEEDAHAMLGGDTAGSPERQAEIIARLVRLGLVRGVSGRSRLAVPPPVRTWVCRRLIDKREREWREVAIECHRSHYLAGGEQRAAEVQGQCPRKALDWLSLELEDILAIYDSALAKGDLESAARAVLIAEPVLARRGPANMLRDYVERVLGRLGEDAPALRSRLSLALASDLAVTDRRLSREYALQAVTAADAAEDARVRAEALQRTAWTTYHGSAEHAVALLDEAADLYGADSRGRAWTQLRKAQLWHHRGSYEDALRHYEEAERTDERLRGTLLEYELRHWRGETLTNLERFDAALNELNAAERIAIEVDLPAERGTIGSAKAIVDVRCRRFESAEVEFAKLRDDARLRGNRYQEALALANLADTHRFARELAEQRLCESSELFRELGVEINLADALANRAIVLRGSARRGDAREYAREAHRLYDKEGALDSLNGWLIAATLARAENECGDREPARALARHALSKTEYETSQNAEVRENWEALVQIADHADDDEPEAARGSPAEGRFARH